MSYRVHVVNVAPDVLYVIDASLRLLSMSLLFSFYCPDSLVLTPLYSLWKARLWSITTATLSQSSQSFDLIVWNASPLIRSLPPTQPLKLEPLDSLGCRYLYRHYQILLDYALHSHSPLDRIDSPLYYLIHLIVLSSISINYLNLS